MSFVTVYGTDGKSNVLLEADMAKRVAYVVRKMKENNAVLTLTEGYRPVGSPGDQYITQASRTSTGGSNQWYQWGRQARGETPSALYPGTSRHGKGLALDWSSPTDRDMNLRAHFMAQAGLVRNVPSESWHAEPLQAPTVDLGATPVDTGNDTNANRVLLVEDVPILIQRVEDGAIFAFQGGASHVPSTIEVAAIQSMSRQLGLPVNPIKLGSGEISLISERTRSANGTYIVRNAIVDILNKIAKFIGLKL